MKLALKSEEFVHEGSEDNIVQVLKSASVFRDQIKGADQVELVWDGKDLNVFLAAIDAVWYGSKQIEMLSPCIAAPVKIASYEDIYLVLEPERPDRIPFDAAIPKEICMGAIRRCVESADMLKAIEEGTISRLGFLSIVTCSAIPLQEKVAYLEPLLAREDLFRDVLDAVQLSKNENSNRLPNICYSFILLHSTQMYVDEAKRALRALDLDVGEVLILGEKAYPKTIDGLGYDYGYLGFEPYLSFDALQMYIQREYLGPDDDEEDALIWHTLEKWVPWKDGLMEEAFTYTMIKDQVVFFHRNAPHAKADPYLDGWYSASRLFDRLMDPTESGIPMPFQVGDVVRIDCRPFAPVRYACLIDFLDGERYEFSFLHWNDHGLWEALSLDSYTWADLAIQSSVPLRMEKVDFVPEECALLHAVSEFLGGDSMKGKALWKALQEIGSPTGLFTEEEVRKAMENRSESVSLC